MSQLSTYATGTPFAAGNKVAGVDSTGAVKLFPERPAFPRRILALGDSITELCSEADAGAYPGGYVRLNAEGYLGWALRFLGQRVSFDPALNKGVQGDTTAQILARFDTDVTPNKDAFDILFLMAGTNDARTGLSMTAALSNVQQIVGKAFALGKWVVLITPPPYGSTATAIVAGTRALTFHFNTLLKEWAATQPGLIFVDPYRSLSDPQSTSGYGLDSLFWTDGIHPCPGGAQRIGKAVADVLAPFLSPLPRGLVSAADTYDATNNPRGNWLSNGAFVSTGGTGLNPDFSGAAVNGSLAGGWTLWHFAGTSAFSDCTCSLTPQAAGIGAAPGSRQRLAFSTASGAIEAWIFFQSVTSMPIGAKVIAECEIDISNASNLRQVSLQLSDSDNVSFPLTAEDNGNRFMIDTTTDKSLDALPYSGLVFRTPVYMIRAGNAVFCRLRVDLDASSAAASATIDIYGMTLRIVG